MEIFARLSRGDHFKAAMGPSSFNRRLFGRGPGMAFSRRLGAVLAEGQFDFD